MKRKRKRQSRYVVISGLAYQLAQRCVDLYSHRNSPKIYTQPQLLACVLLGFYLDLSYRDIEQLLLASDKICQKLELADVPHASTYCRMYHRLRMPLLRRLNHLLVKMAGVEEDAIVVDATGLTSVRASRHYISRTGRHMTDWIKAYYVAAIKSLLILGWHYARGPGGMDSPYLKGLRRQGKVYTPLISGRHEYILLADKGFDGAHATADDLIAPRRSYPRIVRPDRLARQDLTSQARLDGLMGQRWKIETIISVIKRKTGDTLRSKTDIRQRREVAVKALVYNLHRYYTLLICLFYTLQQSNAGEHLVQNIVSIRR